MNFGIIAIGILGFTSSLVGGILIFRDRLETHKNLIQQVEQEERYLDEALSQIGELELSKTNAGRELMELLLLDGHDNIETFKSWRHKGYTITNDSNAYSKSEMRAYLDQLEDQKRQLEIAIVKASQWFKWSLWGIGIGIVLLPLYWSGIPILLVAGAGAIYYSAKRAISQDKLGALKTEIHNLETSMV